LSPNIDPRDQLDPEVLDALSSAFRAQLLACLEECVRGRRGLFAEAVGEENAWPEAARLRELALALQGVYSAHETRNALADEFLDLCSISGGSMHGEANSGERRLARAFLERIERGQVGTPTEGGTKPW
jgi:hypothetical protein